MNGILEIKRKAQAGETSNITVTGFNIPARTDPPAQRGISAIYKAVQAYHVRHDPPQDTPGYWEWAISDLQAVSVQHDNSPLVKDLLAAALSELEREYKHMLADQGGSNTYRPAAADRQTAAQERPTN